MQFTEQQARNIAREHLSKYNPRLWNGKGKKPSEFSCNIQKYILDNYTELSINFELFPRRGWSVCYVLRDRNSGRLVEAGHDGNINSEYEMAKAIMRVCDIWFSTTFTTIETITGLYINESLQSHILQAVGIDVTYLKDINEIAYAILNIGDNIFRYMSRVTGKITTLRPDRTNNPVNIQAIANPIIYIPAQTDEQATPEYFKAVFDKLEINPPKDFDWDANIIKINGKAVY